MTRDAIQASLDKIRGMLQADGGDVEFVDATEDGVVKVRLTGRCGSCPMSQMTLKLGVERQLKEDVPGVREVISV
jgi:Fe-S cluster biogenesis protein NfuA